MIQTSLTHWLNSRAQSLKGDAMGGITSSLLPFPRAIALGALVFSPLGPDYIPLGIVAGLISLFVANLIAAPIGTLHIMNNAPFSLSSFMLLGASTLIVDRLNTSFSGDELAFATIALVFFTVTVSGIVQTLFGLFKLGGIAKYIPYPVIAGLLNGSAILIMLSQLDVFIGLPNTVAYADLLAQLSEFQPLTLFVGLFTCFATWAAPKFTKRIPAPFVGIFAGSILYGLLVNFGFSNSLGPTVGAIPPTLPTPEFIDDFFVVLNDPRINGIIWDLCLFGFGIAAIDALRTLLVCTVGESLTLERVNSNRELVAQGVGNICNGFFGGISTTGCVSSAITNHEYGGRSAFTRVFASLFPLLTLLFLSPTVANIPVVVLAGVLIITAFESLNKWSLTLPFQIKAALKREDLEPIIDLSLVLMVTIFLIVFGILEALGVGLIISLTWFVVRMSKSGIYRTSQGTNKRSNTTRTKDEMACLDKEGYRIHILELEGPLFFGTADKLSARIDKLLNKEVRFIILDFSRITTVDTTGGQILQQSVKKCASKDVALYFSGIKTEDIATCQKELSRNIRMYGHTENCFASLEVAMAVAEDRLLDQFVGANRYYKEIPLTEVTTFRLLNKEELDIVQSYLTREVYPPKSAIFYKNDKSSTVYFMVKGRAHITQPGWDAEYERLATMGPGATFGEMSLLDGLPRSADAITGQMETVCYLLSLDDLSRLTNEYPQISHKLILGIGMELSMRLRIKNISAS